ncbi:MAG: UTP--glucose-1-phosphate uridylyltransferase [bacterium]|nr:UTP--glucose-1-phosphate uridylyltransferase [bacterium]
MSKKITKALIPAAGFGTRFLPQTKAMPKEMMPLVDKPIIQRVVEELVEAGIETIVIVTGLYKRAIEDHFDNQYELEDKLLKAGKEKELEEVRKISDLAEFIYLRQKGPVGNATPILNARHIMGEDPFLLFWGDDFIDAEPSRARQLIHAYEKYNSMIIGALRITSEDGFKKYGFAGGEEIEPGVIKVNKVIEKPGNREASPSDLASISGFVITPDIYQYLEEARDKLQEGEELVYLSGIQGAINDGVSVHAIELKNAIYRDTGNKLEYLKTVVEYGLKHEEFGEEFKDFLKNLKF